LSRARLRKKKNEIRAHGPRQQRVDQHAQQQRTGHQQRRGAQGHADRQGACGDRALALGRVDAVVARIERIVEQGFARA